MPKWEEIENELILWGYIRGYPPRTGIIDGAAIDKEVSESYPCSKCGGEMEYVPMIAPGSYRAFARCKSCGETLEF